MAREVKIPVPGRCVAGVWDMGRRYQCWHRGRYADDGSPGDRWCGTHCPAKVKERRQAKEEEQKAVREMRNAAYRHADATGRLERAVLDAAVAHVTGNLPLGALADAVHALLRHRGGKE